MGTSGQEHFSRRPPSGKGRSTPQSAADLLPAALRSLGVPSARLTNRLRQAWDAVCEESWRGRTLLRRLEGGVLEIGVGSAVLRDELTNYHRDRLLAVLRTALPDVPLIGMRFVSDPADGDGV